MSQVKRTMEADEAKAEVATAICVRADALTHCEHHGITYQNSGDEVAAFKTGNYLFDRESWVSDAFESRRDMTDWIRTVLQDNSNDECVQCEKLMAE